MGLNLAGELFNIDPFLYMVIGGAVEIPGILFAIPSVNYFGRRLSLGVLYFLTGTCLLGFSITPTSEFFFLFFFFFFLNADSPLFFSFSLSLPPQNQVKQVFPPHFASHNLTLTHSTLLPSYLFSPFTTRYRVDGDNFGIPRQAHHHGLLSDHPSLRRRVIPNGGADVGDR